MSELETLLGYDFKPLIELVELTAGDASNNVCAFYHCSYCGGKIQASYEDEYLWFHDGGFGIDVNDLFFMGLIHEIQREHPEWKLRGACKHCYEELTFLENHKCGKNIG